MKKKCNAVCGASVLVVTLVSLALFWQSRLHVYAAEKAPPERLEMTFRLTSDETVQVPRYIVEENAAYALDEASIVVEEIESGSAAGADVVTFSRKVEDLSDNDLARIEKRTVMEGIDCELLSAVYKVEEESENGMPVRYSAVCEYGGLKKYGTSYPTAWRMTAGYDLCETLSEPEIVEIREERVIQKNAEYDNTRTERVTGKTEDEGEEKDAGEEGLSPRPEIRRIRIKPPSKEKDKKVADLFRPLAAAAAGAGMTVPFIIWFSILTAPLFGMKEDGKYRYIGRIRLKREEGGYTAYLTKRLCSRAELPVFQIKLQKRVWKRAKTGVLLVHCPGGKRIMATVGRTVRFTVEGD